MFGGAKITNSSLPINYQAQCDGLHPARRYPMHTDLATQCWRELITIQTIQHPPRLLRINKIFINIARLLHGAQHGSLRNFAERYAPHGLAASQQCFQVPGNGLAFAVRVGGKQNLFYLFGHALELCHDFLARVREYIRGLIATEIYAHLACG